MIGQAPGAARGDLRAALLRLDLRVRCLVDQFRAELAERARDPLRGLCVSETDVDGLLAELDSETGERDRLDKLFPLIAPSAPSRLSDLAELFGLSACDQDILMICLAPDLDLRYERLYGYLQDDVTRRRPTVELVLRLLGSSFEERASLRVALGRDSHLARAGLLAPAPEDHAEQAPLLARPLWLEERVVDYLLGSDRLDPRIAPFAKLSPANQALVEPLMNDTLTGLARLLSNADRRASGPVLYLEGPPGSDKRGSARRACAVARRVLLVVDLPDLVAASTERTLPNMLSAVAREALLQDAVLCLDGFDVALRDEHQELGLLRPALLRCLGEQRGPSLLLGESHWEPATWLDGLPGARILLPLMGAAARADLWHSQLNRHLSAAGAADLAARYRLADEESIQAVVAAPLSRSALRGALDVEAEDVRAAARAVCSVDLDRSLRRGRVGDQC